jgi:ABC-2 type transport system ATP-binding protein
LIEFRGVRKRFPGSSGDALSGIDLQVPDGSIVGLVGRNGAGKSTLLRLAAGLSRPTEGGITVAGHDLALAKTEASRQIGWVPDVPRFEPEERPQTLLTHLTRLDGRSRKEAARRAAASLDRVGLTEVMDRPIRTLSQGQARRLALAAAWLEDPTHMLYDEVTNGLDLDGRALLEGSLKELRQRGGLAILASHRIEEVESWCDRIVVLQAGRTVATLPGRDASASAARKVHVVLERPAPERLERLREFGRTTLTGETAELEVDAPGDRDLVGELVADGYRVREIRSIRADLAEYLGEAPP